MEKEIEYLSAKINRLENRVSEISTFSYSSYQYELNEDRLRYMKKELKSLENILDFITQNQ